MKQVITETERNVIDIVVNQEPTTDGNSFAVDRAMGWSTIKTEKFLVDLMKRGLIQKVPIVSKKLEYDPKFCWKEGGWREGEDG